MDRYKTDVGPDINLMLKETNDLLIMAKFVATMNKLLGLRKKLHIWDPSACSGHGGEIEM